MAAPRLNQASDASARSCPQLPEKLSAVLPRLLAAVPEFASVFDAVRNCAPAGACSPIALVRLAENLSGRSCGVDEAAAAQRLTSIAVINRAVARIRTASSTRSGTSHQTDFRESVNAGIGLASPAPWV